MRGPMPMAIATILFGLCDGRQSSPDRGGSATENRAEEWVTSASGPERAIVMLPREPPPHGGWPLLIALHGEGEARRGLRQGAMGWVRDYELGAADAALRRGRLSSEDFHGFVAPERLRVLNQSLRVRPYRGLVVACPYTYEPSGDQQDPDFLRSGDRHIAEGFDRFVVGEFLSLLRSRYPLSADRTSTGIDGVSLGGMQALLIGLEHPETFGAVGGMQPAMHHDTTKLFDRLRRGGAARPRQRLRLVTSVGDHFHDDVQAFSQDLDRNSFAHELLVTPGPHDYEWNRGPGAIEMLLWFDRALRTESP